MAEKLVFLVWYGVVCVSFFAAGTQSAAYGIQSACQAPGCRCLEKRSEHEGVNSHLDLLCDCSMGVRNLVLGAPGYAMLTFSVENITVRNCDNVVVVSGALGHVIALVNLRLESIGRLTLENNSLAIVKHPHIISHKPRGIYIFKDIGELIIHETAFRGIEEVFTLEINDVDIKHIPSNSFSSMRKIDNFIIVNSTIITIQSGAFGAEERINSLKITSSDVWSIDSSAFNITTGGFEISSSRIGNMAPSSVQVTADFFLLAGNGIVYVDSGALLVNFYEAAIKDNYIDTLKGGALWEMSPREKLPTQQSKFTLKNNLFKKAEYRSLDINDSVINNIETFEIKNNWFSCNCTYLQWLVTSAVQPETVPSHLQNFYSEIFHSGWCDSEENKPLTEMYTVDYNGHAQCREREERTEIIRGSETAVPEVMMEETTGTKFASKGRKIISDSALFLLSLLYIIINGQL